jgi:hypothetical protein
MTWIGNNHGIITMKHEDLLSDLFLAEILSQENQQPTELPWRKTRGIYFLFLERRLQYTGKLQI